MPINSLLEVKGVSQKHLLEGPGIDIILQVPKRVRDPNKNRYLYRLHPFFCDILRPQVSVLHDPINPKELHGDLQGPQRAW